MAQTLMETVTRDGALPIFNKRINDVKLAEADRIIEGVSKNDNRAVLEFKEHLGAIRGEAIHTTGDDFIFAFAQLTQLSVVDEWEAAERTWSDAIETTTVSSFEAPIDYSIKATTDGFARPQTEPNKPGHIVPKIAEGAPYPHFHFSGERSGSGGIHKAGGRYDLTFEMIIKDVVGIVPMIPKLINESLLEREEYDAWQGLVEFIDVSSNHLTAGTTMIGEAVTTDSVLTRAALALALRQAANREINGKKVKVRAYNLIVPTGAGEDAKFLLNTFALTGLEVVNGLQTQIMSAQGYNPLSKIAGVIETDYLSGTQWALIPAKGAITGPDKFYKLGQLVGHIGPELRLENATGNYLGGGAVGPFEGDFETDSAAFRGRIITGGIGWYNQFAVFSDGTGAP